MADIKTKMFFGTAQTVFDSTSDVTAGNFSGAGTNFDNTTDASVPYATHAVAMLECDMGTAPAVGTTIQLWGLMVDVDGFDDDTDAPATTVVGGARFLGAWTMAASTSLQRRTIVISLEGITKFTPYIFNGTAVTLDATSSDSNLVVKITPFTYGVTT